MTTRIFKIKQKANAEQVIWSNKVADYLREKCFDGSELDDLVYEIAESVSLSLQSEFSDAMARKLATLEYTAADEINLHSMSEQLLLIRSWHMEDDVLRHLLKISLGIEMPDEFWVKPVI